jgi:hypothetical protein
VKRGQSLCALAVNLTIASTAWPAQARLVDAVAASMASGWQAASTSAGCSVQCFLHFHAGGATCTVVCCVPKATCSDHMFIVSTAATAALGGAAAGAADMCALQHSATQRARGVNTCWGIRGYCSRGMLSGHVLPVRLMVAQAALRCMHLYAFAFILWLHLTVVAPCAACMSTARFVTGWRCCCSYRLDLSTTMRLSK